MKLPRVVPMRPVQVPEAFNDRWYTFELKYDGFRGVFYGQGRRGWFESKQQRDITAAAKWLPNHLLEALSVKDVVLDGEIVVMNDEDRPIFLDLMNRTREPVYVVFDLLWLNGNDLRPLPLRERRKKLHRLIPEDTQYLRHVVSVERDGISFFKHIQTFDLEGMVAKQLAKPYGEPTKWLKVLNPHYSQRRDERWRRFQRKR
jgi:bifunctional non-homologous end joining protein LigD